MLLRMRDAATVLVKSRERMVTHKGNSTEEVDIIQLSPFLCRCIGDTGYRRQHPMVDDESVDARERSERKFHSLGTVLMQHMSDIDSQDVLNVSGRVVVESRSLKLHHPGNPRVTCPALICHNAGNNSPSTARHDKHDLVCSRNDAIETGYFTFWGWVRKEAVMASRESVTYREIGQIGSKYFHLSRVLLLEFLQRGCCPGNHDQFV